MTDTGSSSDSSTTDVYSIIDKIVERINYQTGGEEKLIKQIAADTNELVNDVPLRIEDAKVRIQDSVASVGANVDYSRALIIDKLGAKIDTLSNKLDKSNSDLIQTIVEGDRTILAAIVATNDHMNELFDRLDTVVEKVIKAFGDQIGQLISESIKALDEQLTNLTEQITKVLEANTNATNELRRTTEEGFTKLDNRLETFDEHLVEALKEQTQALNDSRMEVGKFIADNISQAISDSGGGISNAILAVGGAIGATNLVLAEGLASVDLAIGAASASEKAQWAGVITQLTLVLASLTSFWDQVVKPLMDNPEEALAEIIATITNLYYEVGKATYDKLDLDKM